MGAYLKYLLVFRSTGTSSSYIRTCIGRLFEKNVSRVMPEYDNKQLNDLKHSPAQMCRKN